MMLALLAGAAMCAANGGPADAVALEEYIINDLMITNAGQPTAAMAVLAPRGWRTQGGYGPPRDPSCGLQRGLEWRATSPDGTTGVAVFAEERWTASSYKAQFSSCPSREIWDVETYLKALLKERNIKAEIFDARNRKDLARALDPENSSSSPDAGQPRVDAQAAEFAMRAPAIKGERNDGESDMLAIAAIAIYTPAQHIPENEKTGVSLPTLFAFAPPGALDRDLVEAIRSSPLVNPAWVRAMRKEWGVPSQTEPERIAPEPPFPTREAGAETTNCNATYRPIGNDGIFQRADGRYFFIPLYSTWRETGN